MSQKGNHAGLTHFYFLLLVFWSLAGAWKGAIWSHPQVSKHILVGETSPWPGRCTPSFPTELLGERMVNKEWRYIYMI